jgi:hypothetical protein
MILGPGKVPHNQDQKLLPASSSMNLQLPEAVFPVSRFAEKPFPII